MRYMIEDVETKKTRYRKKIPRVFKEKKALIYEVQETFKCIGVYENGIKILKRNGV